MTTTLVDAIIISAQPGSGKSTLLPLVAAKLTQSVQLPFISLDNEHFGVQPSTRVKIAEAMGFSNPDDPGFRSKIGFPILLDCMQSTAEHLKSIAIGVPNVVGLIHATEKDPASRIAGVPYWEKLKTDYAELGVNILGVVVINFVDSDANFVAEFRKRLERGADGSAQRALDAPKMEMDDLLLRKSFIDKCVSQGFTGTHFGLDNSIEECTNYLAEVIDLQYFNK